MSFRRILAILALCTVPILAADRPLTDEDIVRRVISGESHERIITLIRDSTVDFDLSDEMVGEMKLAGVPDRIVEAMRDRQLELNPPIVPEIEVEAAPALTVHFKGTSSIVFPAELPDEAVRKTGLSVEAGEHKITGAALFIGCIAPTHVPNHWRSKTPMGRDFAYARRHRLLSFAPDYEAVTGGILKKVGLSKAGVRLKIPQTLNLELDRGGPHELIIGIAFQAGDRYYAYRQLPLEGVVPGESATDLTIRIRQVKSASLEFELMQIKNTAAIRE